MNEKISRRKFNKIASIGTLGIATGCKMINSYDTIIKNGNIIDGTDSESYLADIGIISNKIRAIGDLSSKSAKTIIDATDKVVSPGFIDIHTHTDIELLVDPNAKSKIFQGVTTEISGNCGYSPFPLNEDDFQKFNQKILEKYGISVDWHDISGFLNAIEEKKISINYATFTGHGDLRSFVVGKNDTGASAKQIKKMQQVLKQSMRNGSLGLSTGLEYSPGSFASTDELIELCKVVAQEDGVYATHIRDEQDTVEDAIQEAIKICKKSNVSLQISHLKANYKSNWHKIDNILNMITEAHENGYPVTADRYPYIAYGTGLSSLLPIWSRQGNNEDIINRLNRDGDVDKIRDYVVHKGEKIGGWNRIIISFASNDDDKKWEGLSIEQCCEISGRSPFNFIQNILTDNNLGVSIVGFGMSEYNIKKVLSHPLVMIGSDGNAVSPTGKLSTGKPHPRYYGTFPRVLGKYSRNEQLFDLSTAIKKMTSMPAQKLGLTNRGILSINNIADITIFNPNTIIDNATFKEPHQLASGIDHVLVNGGTVIKDGVHTGTRSGAVLRKTS